MVEFLVGFHYGRELLWVSFRQKLHSCHVVQYHSKHQYPTVMTLRQVFVEHSEVVAEGHPKEFSAVVKAHKEFYSWHDDLRRKRKALNPKEVSCVYTGRLLFDYYLFKKNKFSKLNKNRITKQQ